MLIVNVISANCKKNNHFKPNLHYFIIHDQSQCIVIGSHVMAVSHFLFTRNMTYFPNVLNIFVCFSKGGHIVIVMREEFIYTAPEFRGGQLDSAVIKLCEEKVWRFATRERYEEPSQTPWLVSYSYSK